MSSVDEMKDYANTLSNEELVARLRSGTLTESATSIYRQELLSRGIDIEVAPFQSPQANTTKPKRYLRGLETVYLLLRRVLRFPLRALLGVEPLWVVIVFGAGLVLLLFIIIIYGLTLLLLLQPMPPYVLTIGYAATIVLVLSEVWFALALWFTTKRVKSYFWKVVVRVLAVWVALAAIYSTPRIFRVMDNYFGVFSTGAMHFNQVTHGNQGLYFSRMAAQPVLRV